MNAIVFEVKALFYSYKPPIAYQIKTSNIMPQPSSLVGALYRSYVESNGFSYSKETYNWFLNQISFAGFAIIPHNGVGTVIIKDFPVLIKHWRMEERGDKEPEFDAMIRHYFVSNGRIIGIVGVETEDAKPFIDAVSAIEYLGNSESLVSIRVIKVAKPNKAQSTDKKENLDRYYIAQVISDNTSSLPSIGIIEQCGRLSELPWGSRESGNVCYVWEPLEVVSANRYRPLKAIEILNHFKDDLFVIDIENKFGLTFIMKGFDCLKPRGITTPSSGDVSRGRRRGKGGYDES